LQFNCELPAYIISPVTFIWVIRSVRGLSRDIYEVILQHFQPLFTISKN